jgi:hypothetical protein
MVLFIHKISINLEYTNLHDYLYCKVYIITYQVIYSVTFLEALAKLRKATISFGMPVCPSVWHTSALKEGFKDI